MDSRAGAHRVRGGGDIRRNEAHREGLREAGAADVGAVHNRLADDNCGEFPEAPGGDGGDFPRSIGLEQAAAGVSGYMVKQAAGMGIRRGVFSNEAGLGSSPSAHASSEETEPCILGMWSIVEITFNTLIMCSMTALVLLCCPCRAAPMDEFSEHHCEAAVLPAYGAGGAGYAWGGTFGFRRRGAS